MTTATTRPGPNGRARPSLGDQLDRLDGIVNGLSGALNESVTAAVTAGVGQAVREAVETATREVATRSAPQAAVIIDSRAAAGWRPSRRFWCWGRKIARRMFASVVHVAGRHFRRFGATLVFLARRTMLAPRRLAAFTLAGIIAGVAAGLSGPLIGAALCGLAGVAADYSASPGE